jgi:hypothetical protein
MMRLMFRIGLTEASGGISRPESFVMAGEAEIVLLHDAQSNARLQGAMYLLKLRPLPDCQLSRALKRAPGRKRRAVMSSLGCREAVLVLALVAMLF